jgi:hypothetical protein
MPTHFITVFKMPKWAIGGIDKLRRSFLWRDTNPDNVRVPGGGGTLLGELEILLEAKETWVSGIKDIERFNMALRLKCL